MSKLFFEQAIFSKSPWQWWHITTIIGSCHHQHPAKSIVGTPNIPLLFSGAHCLDKFTRKEHIQRHIWTSDRSQAVRYPIAP